jgi:hypothetical protein
VKPAGISGIKRETVWLQDPSEMNGDNLDNIRSETSRLFRNKKRDCLKDKIDELARNSKNKNIRDLCRGIITLRGVTSLEIT